MYGRLLLGLALLLTLLTLSSSKAQTLGPGVINAPPTVIDDFQSIGAETWLNVAEGGQVGSFFDALAGSVVNVEAGNVGTFFDAYSESEVNLRGGSVGSFFNANSGSVVNISGGSIGQFFSAHAGSEINLYGTAFYVNGDELESLTLDQPYTLSDRDINLAGVLADGSLFSFTLDPNPGILNDYFDASSLLTLTLVAGPEPTIPGDYNSDGQVDAADYTVWRDHEGELFALPNRVTSDISPVSEADYDAWVASYGQTMDDPGTTSVPEPNSVLLLAGIALCRLRRTRCLKAA